ncbi:MAG TPA: hypothetical protein VIT64_14690 [Ilumatobacteraceae bacterium]
MEAPSLVSDAGHLVRRFAGSLSRRPPSPDDCAWAMGSLLPGEADLWGQLSVQDQRHSIEVAHRFVAGSALLPGRAEVAAALLHDIGKIDSGLGTFGRVAATLWGALGGARAERGSGRIGRYLRHEAIGAELLVEVGSEARTLELVAGRADPADPVVAALARADQI